MEKLASNGLQQRPPRRSTLFNVQSRGSESGPYFSDGRGRTGEKSSGDTVSPGTIQTPLTRQDTPEMELMMDHYVEAVVPIQRWGQADEVAKAVVFLASDSSSYMTGGDLLVDGGLGQL